MNLKPLADRVVVRPSAAEEKTKGGIIVPDTAKEKPVWGEIIAVGPGKTSDEGKVDTSRSKGWGPSAVREVLRH